MTELQTLEGVGSPQAPPEVERTTNMELEDIRALLWGSQISETVFARWSQGQ